LDDDTLSEVSKQWDSASVYAEQQQRQWATNEALANGRHITPRKAGRSSLFVPKIPAYIKRKMVDVVGQFTGDNPVSIKNSITSHPVGAKIKQEVHNYYIRHHIDYTSLIYNTAYSSYTYNYAPLFIDWVEEYEDIDVDNIVQMPDGTQVTETTTMERLVASYPVVESIPPEDFRLDPSVAWDELDDARYVGFRTFISKEAAQDKIDSKEWPKVAEEYYQFNSITNSTIGNNVKYERSSNASPFANSQSFDTDNGLLEIRYHYYFEETKDGWQPVRTVTLGDAVVLEDAEPLSVNWGGDKHAWPFVLGQVYPKPFEQYSAALPEQAKDLQIEVNAIRNQRRDNVSLILNPEKYVTPQAGVTPAQLAFSYPGKIVAVDNLNAVQWQTVPDVTSSGHNEEARAESDLDKLLSEGALRQGVEGKRKESATAIQMMSSNASAATGLDSTMLMTSAIKPLHEKIGNAITQKAPEELFVAAAADKGVSAGFDPYLAATQGDFTYNVFSSSSQNELANALTNASNLMGMIQTTYGPNANYKPLVDSVLEVAGYDPDSIIPNPAHQGAMVNPAQQDMGGVDPANNPSVSPRAAMLGGGTGIPSAGNNQ